ncbi:hypothetical protein I350_01056 [Cryptococcus amylolentus CBS 6273]|uniref:DUF427 domain-containing protein n=1 Tax=Cryptococcus amylolentus CBS 6273 TaxID=1296118 RepID=A0A1E3KBM0_9TREE|nr:hypothetical protein I350_01056 [Cryptococcus amylolentus CBS 6273]
MSADQQLAVFLGDKILAQAHVSDLTHVEGKYVPCLSPYHGDTRTGADMQRSAAGISPTTRLWTGADTPKARRLHTVLGKVRPFFSLYFIAMGKELMGVGSTGDAGYYNYKSDDGEIKDIAWFYPTPKNGAEEVEGRVAFYIGKVPGLRTGDPPV